MMATKLLQSVCVVQANLVRKQEKKRIKKIFLPEPYIKKFKMLRSD